MRVKKSSVTKIDNCIEKEMFKDNKRRKRKGVERKKYSQFVRDLSANIDTKSQ